MKKILMTVLATVLPLMGWAEVSERLTSPDGRYVFNFRQHDDGRLTYSLTYDGLAVVEESQMGVEIENRLFEKALGVPNEQVKHWCENLRHTGTERTSRDTTWAYPTGE